jgi:D-alanine-D-alanine ligase
MDQSLTVGVLFGGRSGEHEVSIRSATCVAAALAERHRIASVFIDRGGRWLLQQGLPQAADGEPVVLVPGAAGDGRLVALVSGRELARLDVVFPVLHGPYGEDGTVQGLLELGGVPYVGSGVTASAAGMDKELMKALFAQAGLPQVAYRVMRGRDTLTDRELLAALGLPLFVKPANLGSSVGVTKVQREEALGAALDLAFAYDRKVVIEAGVDAREIEVAVLGNDDPEASVPGEIRPDRDFYDYDSKYDPASRTELFIPAPLDDVLAAEARRLALLAFSVIDAAGFARVDLFLERAGGRLLVNEINTIPGFTAISMFPKLWEASGVPLVELVDRLVALALERHASRSRLRTTLAAR